MVKEETGSCCEPKAVSCFESQTESSCDDGSCSNESQSDTAQKTEQIHVTHVGVLACSGEECLGGTISRLATRRVMGILRPNRAVTLCLPLYIAGGEEERDFAKEYPVITVEGCLKCCAARATERFSGKICGTVSIEEILGGSIALSKTVSGRELSVEHKDMVKIVARAICEKMDAIV